MKLHQIGRRNSVLAVALLVGAASNAANAGERANRAIDECIEHATEQYQIDRSDARFWQMSQAGRYMRVWLKLRTGDERIKALCKVHKTKSGEELTLKQLD
ncbi:MAG: hypothetical protein AB8B48_05850 [Pseudomonadales bacterium]